MRKLTLDIAWSLLMARWKQTLVAAVGVTFSITMFIALLSFMTGLNKLLDSLIVNRTPHIRLFNEVQQNPHQPISQAGEYKNYYHFISSIKTGNSREEIYNSGSILEAVRADTRVQGVSPKINAPVFFNNGAVRLNGVVNGIDAGAENRLFHFYDYITKGNAADLSIVPASIVLGKALADKLAADVGDMVYLTTFTGEIFPLEARGLLSVGHQRFRQGNGLYVRGNGTKAFGQAGRFI